MEAQGVLGVKASAQDALSEMLRSGERSVVISDAAQVVGVVENPQDILVVTAVPLGVALTRPRLRSWAPRVLALVNVGQTVPSLAVVALSVGLLGLHGVDASISEAARGRRNLIIADNNTSRWQVLVLGAALPVLMALIADALFESLEKKVPQ